MSPSPQLVTAPSAEQFIGDLEAKAREYQTLASQCNEAAATLRRIYSVSTIAAAASVTRGVMTAAAVRERENEPAKLAPPPFVSDPVDDAILETLARAKQSLRSGEILEEMGRRDLSYEIVRRRLNALASIGRVIQTGIGSARRHRIAPDDVHAFKETPPTRPGESSGLSRAEDARAGRVDVTRSAERAPAAASTTKIGRPDTHAEDQAQLRAVIVQVLEKDGERQSMAWLLERVQKDRPWVRYDTLNDAVGDLIKAKEIGISTVGLERRYQRTRRPS